MSRIVLTSFGSYGDLFPYLGLALELQERGHDTRLAVPAAYQSLVEQEGIAFHAVRPDVDLSDREAAARVMHPRTGSQVLFRDFILPNLENSYRDLEPVVEGADLVVTHPAALAGPIVAEALAVPWASTVLAPMSFFSIYDPMVPAPVPWIHALTSRSLNASRLFLQLTDRITRKWAQPVYRLRKDRGLPPRGNPILRGQHSPHLVLGLFSRVLAKAQPDWPGRTRIVGAILHNGAERQSLSVELEDFLERGEPPLVFTLGTSAVAAAGSFYETSAEVARRLGCRAVLLVGRHPENRPKRRAKDILVEEYVPHAALFPRAAAVIHQGGAGTLHQGLRAGRPMLVVPHAHDQLDNAFRAERVGVSRTLFPDNYRPKRLEHELQLLLGDARYTDCAGVVAQIVRKERGEAAAADAIEELLAAVR